MLEQLAIGVASLWSQSTGTGLDISEQEIALSRTPTEITSPIEFTAMGIRSGEPLPEIFFRAETYNEWRELHVDDDFPTSSELLSGNPRNKIWLKSSEPFSGKIVWMDTRIPDENLIAKFDPFDDDKGDNPLTGLSHRIRVMPPEYVSREGWEANEGLRTWKPFRGFQSYFREIIPEAKMLPRSLRPKIIARKDDEGRQLTWPMEENREINKFVIHHTGEVIDESRNPKEIMRAIYAFHTLTRGWGDVGYHYVIDKKGNIYEGRAGGPTIVGAHTAYYNVGTIGIALMGNFQREKPTVVQLEVLTLLMADHANRYKVEPKGRGNYLGKNSYNISGHRDVAKRGHGTACPGKYLVKKLPWIRKETDIKAEMLRGGKKTGRDFLAKSNKAANIRRNKVFKRAEKIPAISLANSIGKPVILKRGERTVIEARIRNGSKFDWPKGAELKVKNLPDRGILIGKFRSIEKIRSGRIGTFRANVKVKDVPNGLFELTLIPKIFRGQMNATFDSYTIKFPVQVSGDKGKLVTKFTKPMKVSAIRPHRNIKATGRTFHAMATKKEEPKPEIKVKLSYFDKNIAYLRSKESIEIWSKNKFIAKVSPMTKIKALPSDTNHKITVIYGKQKFDLKDPKFKTKGIIEIVNYDRDLGSFKYNTFRRQINVHAVNDKGTQKLLLVNQLSIEEYLWGLGEEPSGEPTEKKHAIQILARSYALVYSGSKRKFATTLYDLEDSAESSQLYLGYEWENYHPEQKRLIKATEGRVITHNGQPVVGPYFTQSAGYSSDKWSTQYPWTKEQPLPFDEGLDQKGHGVGLSGNTARRLAWDGKNYKEIINYFFEGVEIKKTY